MGSEGLSYSEPRGNGGGSAIPQDEYLSSLVTKAKADNSNFNFSQLCDDVSSTVDSGTGTTTLRAFLCQKWIDLHQTKTKMISGPLYTY